MRGGRGAGSSRVGVLEQGVVMRGSEFGQHGMRGLFIFFAGGGGTPPNSPHFNSPPPLPCLLSRHLAVDVHDSSCTDLSCTPLSHTTGQGLLGVTLPPPFPTHSETIAV